MSFILRQHEPEKYANVASFPASATDGVLVEDLSTHTLYVYNSATTTWIPIGSSSSGKFGTFQVDFGATPGTDYIVSTVADLRVLAGDYITITKIAASNATHSLEDTVISQIDISVGAITAGASFLVHAISRMGRLTGIYEFLYSIGR